ncbi:MULTISPECIES: cell wall metabolism sensor histidine kinase WalK [Bacillaceae]|uniref:histidine kinase n=1 Tax=Gottfriedia luciferensis TaxID=178774 RepID=A0ABX2ZPY7_9BACI|nr:MULTISPECIES: cell wall metabolism sensor histidine kinase WalK [Bacillaceae]ODG91805.1 PAS domain-containing sensor histidine kinase [Gottfriedia luciferensis]PGZ94508.1 cell wall metabolism sensor histidine kinase WalK [Bacillus sp. AFS029533]SFD80132.1 two-component system, OmpR family, sensor histidine kinase VicK [Bacillus sp. UNCCL81]
MAAYNKVGLFKSIVFKFVLVYILLILVAMQIISVYFSRELEKQLVNSFTVAINERAKLLAYNIKIEYEKKKTLDDPEVKANIQKIVSDFGKNIGISDVRVINQNSEVIATSDSSNRSIVGKRTTDILVKRALLVGTRTEKVLIDPKNGHRMKTIVTPVMEGDEIVSAIYTSASMESTYERMELINRIFSTGTLIAVAITSILGILLAKAITKPISEIRRQAQEMAKGNFSRKLKAYSEDEIGELTISFNNLSRNLQQARASTDGERRKLQSVLEHMSDGVIATDRRGKIILLNDPAETMLNVSRETVLNKSILEVLGIEKINTLDDLYDEPDSIMLDYSNNKRPMIIRASLSTIQKESGKVNGLIAVLYDVTEQEKIEQERRDFVSNVSHELRTPLTTMRSYLEALSDGAWENKEIAPKFLQVTQDETERMIRLVNDLLQLSKLDSTEYRLMKDWVNFTELFNRIIDRHEMSKSQEVSFKREFISKTRFVFIDEDRITQVLDNIISNALKYSPEGGTVTYRIKESRDQILVSITDEGMGIPKENLSKIFDRFYRVDKARSRQVGGSGLGLALAKEMIYAHDGHIWAKSEEGKGTTVYFTLPVADDQEDEWE